MMKTIDEGEPPKGPPEIRHCCTNGNRVRQRVEFFPSAYERYEWRNDLCCRAFLVKICLMISLSDPFDNRWFRRSSDPLYGKHAKNLMKTDVRETEDSSYELDVDLPGFKKDDVTRRSEKRLPDDSALPRVWTRMSPIRRASILRQERYAGSMSRSFYVGDDVESADVSGEVRGWHSEDQRPEGCAEGASEAHDHHDRVICSNASAPRPFWPGRAAF